MSKMSIPNEIDRCKSIKITSEKLAINNTTDYKPHSPTVFFEVAQSADVNLRYLQSLL